MKTLLAALAGAVMISFSAIFFALSDVSPITGAFYREAYALPVLLLLWMARRSADHRPRSRRWLAIGIGLALGADTVAWHASIDLIGAGLATLAANTAVVFVAVGAWIFLGERPRRSIIVAIPVILVGVALVSGVGQGDAFGVDPIRGTLLALLAAMFYAVFILGFRQANDIQAPAAGPLLEATFGAMLTTLILSPFTGGIDFGFTWPEHGWLIALALGSQVIGWMLIGYALPRLPAVETATIILLQPALTLVWGAVIFDERPSPTQILGALIVLGGVGFVAVVRAKREANRIRTATEQARTG
ncbi:MAG TPA: DMT family transporter [Acidimicrobiia bacterium]|nr:DMT family transporter [Acidimicrobiia bacterium]